MIARAAEFDAAAVAREHVLGGFSVEQAVAIAAGTARALGRELSGQQVAAVRAAAEGCQHG